MKKTILFVAFLVSLLAQGRAQNPVNWTPAQLLEPAALAKTLTEGKNIPVLFSVGPGALIPHSTAIGMTRDEENRTRLKEALQNTPKDAAIVVYCGCCPYEHCPNVRPAIALLQELKFTNYKLLDLPKNLKTDWIDKGYPTTKP